MRYSDSTFSQLGLDFDPTADYAGCRICGTVYQSTLDRLVKRLIDTRLLIISKNELTSEEYFQGSEDSIKTFKEAFNRRQRWRELHRRRYHSDEEVESFTRTGFALTPEAAHRLAPIGFAPVGGLHEDIAAAMLEAPRAPTGDEIEDD